MLVLQGEVRSVVGLLILSAATAAAFGQGAGGGAGGSGGGGWITPAAPSVPFTANVQAQNGGAGPEITYSYGIEFVTVGATNGGAGNPAWAGTGQVDLNDRNIGRGSVPYDFRIGRYEVDGAQWARFRDASLAAMADGQGFIPYLSYPSGSPTNGRWAVGNVTWRTAAIYCNWLHNDQRTDRAAFMSGAYDVSTFGDRNGTIPFTDQAQRSPGARFFIPTLDEWMKASHYDPNRSNNNGWWLYSTSSDTVPIGGPPGFGTANAGWGTGGLEEFDIQLGAYSNVQSPWGLFDVAGQRSEWLEDVRDLPGGERLRLFDGSFVTSSPSSLLTDFVGLRGAADPGDAPFWQGFRIAAAVPSPSAGGVAVILVVTTLNRRSRRL